jgi:hypothetical protein
MYLEIYFVCLAVYKVATDIEEMPKYCCIVVRYSLPPQAPVYFNYMVMNLVDEETSLPAN